MKLKWTRFERAVAVLAVAGALATAVAEAVRWDKRQQREMAELREKWRQELNPHFLGSEGRGAPPIAWYDPKTKVLTLTEHGQAVGIRCVLAPSSQSP